ncbi:putative nuclease HARBI1 [Ornithodoros turicata]|uniref:putative nuclease HARBI1 n=1 Tax=Ornithodoros turicata TaxID=34597 RepID=UPI003138EADE
MRTATFSLELMILGNVPHAAHIITRLGPGIASVWLAVRHRTSDRQSFRRRVVAGSSPEPSPSTTSRRLQQSVQRVRRIIVVIIASVYKWPRGEEIARAQHQFYQLASFPGVVGAVDGTHVRIQASSAHETAFVNRKNYHSINVQLIAGADCKILDVVANWPGATHDSRILRESTIGRELEAGVHTGLLLGDSGYPCKRWLMTPFLQPRNRAQKQYNASHSTTRALVERTIGQLKRRFHCLHSELRVLTKHTCPIIVACCVLHNIAKDFGSEVQEADSDNDHDPDYDPQLVSSYEGRQDGFMYRDAIVRQHFT